MKKLLSALLALTLLCGLAALAEDAAQPTLAPEIAVDAPAESLAFSPVGTWYLISFEVTGVTFAVNDMDATLTFNEDGTGALAGLNDMTFAWSYDGESLTATPDGSETPLSVSISEANELSLAVDSMTMTFSMHGPEAQPLPAVALASFDGAWSRRLAIGDVEAPADSVAMQFSCTIENGAVTLVSGDSETSGQGAMEGNALVVEYEDGASDAFYLYNDGTLHLFRTSADGVESEYTLAQADGAPEATGTPEAEAEAAA